MDREEEPELAPAELWSRDITLCLSGGGLRSTLFQLGILTYLAETKRLRQVKAIVSVSGGSILAAHYALHWKRAVQDDAGFDAVARELIGFCRSDIRDRVVIPWLWLRLCPVFWLSGITRKLRGFSRIGRLQAIYHRHFSEKTIGDLNEKGVPQIAFVATDAIKQQRIAFTQQGIVRFPIKSEKPVPIPIIATGTYLSLAVAASSCFPPVFPRMSLDHNDLGLQYDEFDELLNLNDGGVTDNLGIETLLALRSEGRLPAGFCLVADAERPTSRKPGAGALADLSTTSLGISEASKSKIRNELGQECRRVALSARAPDNRGLAFLAETALQRYRTDLDAPRWPEVHALMIHGAAIMGEVANEVDQRDADAVRERVRNRITHILSPLTDEDNLREPTDDDLERSDRRPLWHPLRHIAAMLLVVLLAIRIAIDVLVPPRDVLREYGVEVVEIELIEAVFSEMPSEVSELRLVVDALRSRKVRSVDLSGLKTPEATEQAVTEAIEPTYLEVNEEQLLIIAGLDNLEVLNLGNLSIPSLDPLKKRGTLRSLYLYNTKIADAGSVKSLPPTVVNLSLPSIKVEMIQYLGGIQWLRTGSIETLEADDWSKLNNLEVLEIDSAEGDFAEFETEGFPKLKELRVTNSTFTRLRVALPKSKLVVSGNDSLERIEIATARSVTIEGNDALKELLVAGNLQKLKTRDNGRYRLFTQQKLTEDVFENDEELGSGDIVVGPWPSQGDQ